MTLTIVLPTGVCLTPKKKQKQTLTAQLASVQQENARLEEVVGADNKDDYIEQKAREKGYVKGDEIVFYDISGTE